MSILDLPFIVRPCYHLLITVMCAVVLKDDELHLVVRNGV